MSHTILIVDDIVENIEFVAIYLKNIGYNVITATNGTDALVIIKTQPLDIIFLDIMLPDISGFDICIKVKQIPEYADIPIIFLTSLNDTESIIEGLKSGASDYLVKPINIRELVLRLQNMLELKDAKKTLQFKLQELNIKNQELKEKNKQIIDSVNYAQRIQIAALPDIDYMDKLLKEYFVLFIPKDIVSGDFYWLKYKDSKIILAAGDCTGHGVPGAFMSMLGLSFLNDIIFQIPHLLASVIVEGLNKRISRMLHRNTFLADGIDISVVIIDTVKMELNFAGINTSISIIQPKNQNINTSSTIQYFYRNDKANLTLKGNSFFTGNPKETFNVDDVLIPVASGDTVYMYSDGFADQFNEIDNVRYSKRKFYEKLTEISDNKPDEQKIILSQDIKKWKGNAPQIDDIMVLGIKIQDKYELPESDLS